MSSPKIDPRFEVLKLAGNGAMGKVYKAWDRITSGPVALKVCPPTFRERFVQEAAVLSSLEHPHIVRYVAHGHGRSGSMWLAMEWLEGEDLEARIVRGPLSLGELLRVAIPIADAMAFAHARRVAHRDLKPTNLLLHHGELDGVKVLDFGLARPLRLDRDLTATGMFMGTFEYMPPEQRVDAKRADARSDVFSLGAVLFHCLAGRPPLADSPAQVFDAPRVTSLRSDVPDELDRLIAAMLSPAPADRPRGGAEVLAALRSVNASTSSWDEPTVTTRSEIRALAQTAELPVGLRPFGPSGTVVMPAPGGKGTGGRRLG